MSDIKEYEVWMEGFRATGQSQSAQFVCKAKGTTFKEACMNFKYDKDVINDYSGDILIHKGDSLGLDKHRDYPAIWACKLYDNEADARKAFG